MELEVLKTDGSKTGKKVTLNESVFSIEPNEHAIYLDVKQYLANQRQGTSKTKCKGEIMASTRKIKRQKGTGSARAGSLKSPLFRGGGNVFGPEPRDYRFKLNKKLKRLAKLSVLTQKAKEGNILVVENFNFENPKTKLYIDLMKSLNIFEKKSLLVLGELNKNVYLSSRNLSKVKVVNHSLLSTYDILNAQNLILTESSLEFLNSNLQEIK
ncbi:MAG: 50S ribosomal protein L4 [Bacteroidales bacterium]|nr:50S ribosomal protein L4 [Bacteroidales bacterium]